MVVALWRCICALIVLVSADARLPGGCVEPHLCRAPLARGASRRHGASVTRVACARLVFCLFFPVCGHHRRDSVPLLNPRLMRRVARVKSHQTLLHLTAGLPRHKPNPGEVASSRPATSPATTIAGLATRAGPMPPGVSGSTNPVCRKMAVRILMASLPFSV